MAGLVPAIHAAPPKDRSSMSAPLAKAYWDKAFRSLLLAHGIRCAEHVDGRDKPGQKPGDLPRNALKITPHLAAPQTRLHRLSHWQNSIFRCATAVAENKTLANPGILRILSADRNPSPRQAWAATGEAHERRERGPNNNLKTGLRAGKYFI